MKVRYLGTLLLALLVLFGCDDNTGSLGMGMLPDSDGISAQTTTFDVKTNSFLAEKVYAKTSTGYIGRFTDPNKDNGFGDYEASFLTELNCTNNYTFPALYNDKTHTGTMAGDTVVSMQLVVFYSTWFGDSLNACRMSAYELNDEWLKVRKSADKSYRYTNIDPEKYYDKQEGLIGRKAYTAYDASVPDSIRFGKDSNGNSTYYPNVNFMLSKERGNKILKLNRTNPNYFANADAFIENVFKGVYLKTDYGNGTILYVDHVELKMQFRFHHVDSLGVKLIKKDGTDSLYYSMATVFASTKEVIQANQFKNSDLLKQRAEEPGHTYLKSPAGIFTEAVLPFDEIQNKLTNDTLNAVKLTFTNYNQENNKYEFNMSAPGTVLLLRKKDRNTFFENNDLTDNVTSFIASHNNVATNQYTFRNIARLVSACINEKKAAKEKAKKEAGTAWDESAWNTKWTSENPDWDKVLLIPVVATYDTNSQTPTLTGIQHDLKPSVAKLEGGVTGNPLKIEITYTTFNK